MKQIFFDNVKIEGQPITVNQLIRKFGYDGMYKRMYMCRYGRKMYYQDMLITWELWTREMWWTANGVRYENKIHMAADLKVNYHSLKSRKESEWFFKGIAFKKHEKVTICNDTFDPTEKHIPLKKPVKESLKAVKPTYDKYVFKGIKLVRKFYNGKLVHTYAYDQGAQYLKK